VSEERIQKIIATAGLASRRKAEQWIVQGRVEVNGRPAQLGDRAEIGRDRILVDGKPVVVEETKRTFLLYKPTGYVSTASDPQGRPTVLSFFNGISCRLFPVGRLDLNSDGLILLSNDGDLAQTLMHPRHRIHKTYLVRVRGRVSTDSVRHLRQGVLLDDGLTSPAEVRVRSSSPGHSWLEISLGEGRNRQVRRMCEAVGHPVSRLKRIRIDSLEIGNLKPGQWRELSTQEIALLKKHSK